MTWTSNIYLFTICITVPWRLILWILSSQTLWPQIMKALDLRISKKHMIWPHPVMPIFKKFHLKLDKCWLKWDLNLGPPALKSSALPIRLQSPYIDIIKNSWYKTLVYIFMAQLVTANPKLFSKSPDQELSESVVKVSGNSKFTRLDVREQW